MGLIDILITCKALDEGFDYPDVDAVLLLSSSSSTRQRIQRLGRALRVSDDKNDALIVTIYSSDNEYMRLKDESIDYGDEGIEITWTKLKTTKHN